ncbi:hypothetical protein ZIOFF_048207 [Zingiber officinale]|uniref:DDE Tnp4 domain-containing protein n=1 Tax=Zingiber officinale TaxID=94328 RepID=A0A8J5FUP6_ZINOF|nr:hypothetical protein ZIOFF_048207 [Zingiber officinale]
MEVGDSEGRETALVVAVLLDDYLPWKPRKAIQESNMRQFDRNAILAIVAYVGYLACMQYMIQHVSRIERPTTQSQRCNGNQVRRELMAQLEAHYNARSVIRMSYDAFTRLVAILRGRGLLRDNQYSFVEEQVAKWNTYPSEGFKRRCVKGSASDSRILDNPLSREDNLNAPQGKFYLVDARYMLRSTFLTPYRSTRYHLKEYSQHPPENPKELFNLRHSSLRNAIERAFGVLKNRFPILAEMSRYDVETVSEIVLACCILHNFLVDFDPDEEIIAQVDRDLMNNEPDHGLANGAIARGEDGRRGEILRDSIAAQMWNDYITRH